MGGLFSKPSDIITTISTSTLLPSPCVCGEGGSFVLNFDDVPPLAIGDQPIDSVQPMPLFSPYHQFYFSNGFTVVPPPSVPYMPSSQPFLLEYIPDFSVSESDLNISSNSLGQGISAGIGNSDQGRSGCFSFTFLNASFGCDSMDPECEFTLTGYRFDKDSHISSEVAFQHQSVRACPSLKNCSLTPILLYTSFENLDFIRINLTVAGQPKIWWMDDLSLEWTNKSCEADKCRQQSLLQ